MHSSLRPSILPKLPPSLPPLLAPFLPPSLLPSHPLRPTLPPSHRPSLPSFLVDIRFIIILFNYTGQIYFLYADMIIAVVTNLRHCGGLSSIAGASRHQAAGSGGDRVGVT